MSQVEKIRYDTILSELSDTQRGDLIATKEGYCFVIAKYRPYVPMCVWSVVGYAPIERNILRLALVAIKVHKPTDMEYGDAATRFLAQ